MNTAKTITAIATWSDPPDLGDSNYRWPLALADVRRSRVLAMIRRYGIPCDPSTLTITHQR